MHRIIGIILSILFAMDAGVLHQVAQAGDHSSRYNASQVQGSVKDQESVLDEAGVGIKSEADLEALIERAEVAYTRELMLTESGQLQATLTAQDSEIPKPQHLIVAVIGLRLLGDEIVQLAEDRDLQPEAKDITLRFKQEGSDRGIAIRLDGGMITPLGGGQSSVLDMLLPSAYAQDPGKMDQFLAGFFDGLSVWETPEREWSELSDELGVLGLGAVLGPLVTFATGLMPWTLPFVLAAGAAVLGVELIPFVRHMWNSKYEEAGQVLGRVLKDTALATGAGFGASKALQAGIKKLIRLAKKLAQRNGRVGELGKHLLTFFNWLSSNVSSGIWGGANNGSRGNWGGFERDPIPSVPRGTKYGRNAPDYLSGDGGTATRVRPKSKAGNTPQKSNTYATADGDLVPAASEGALATAQTATAALGKGISMGIQQAEAAELIEVLDNPEHAFVLEMELSERFLRGNQPINISGAPGLRLLPLRLGYEEWETYQRVKHMEGMPVQVAPIEMHMVPIKDTDEGYAPIFLQTKVNPGLDISLEELRKELGNKEWALIEYYSALGGRGSAELNRDEMHWDAQHLYVHNISGPLAKNTPVPFLAKDVPELDPAWQVEGATAGINSYPVYAPEAIQDQSAIIYQHIQSYLPARTSPLQALPEDPTAGEEPTPNTPSENIDDLEKLRRAFSGDPNWSGWLAVQAELCENRESPFGESLCELIVLAVNGQKSPEDSPLPQWIIDEIDAFFERKPTPQSQLGLTKEQWLEELDKRIAQHFKLFEAWQGAGSIEHKTEVDQLHFKCQTPSEKEDQISLACYLARIMRAAFMYVEDVNERNQPFHGYFSHLEPQELFDFLNTIFGQDQNLASETAEKILPLIESGYFSFYGDYVVYQLVAAYLKTGGDKQLAYKIFGIPSFESFYQTIQIAQKKQVSDGDYRAFYRQIGLLTLLYPDSDMLTSDFDMSTLAALEESGADVTTLFNQPTKPIPQASQAALTRLYHLIVWKLEPKRATSFFDAVVSKLEAPANSRALVWRDLEMLVYTTNMNDLPNNPLLENLNHLLGNLALSRALNSLDWYQPLKPDQKMTLAALLREGADESVEKGLNLFFEGDYKAFGRHLLRAIKLADHPVDLGKNASQIGLDVLEIHTGEDMHNLIRAWQIEPWLFGALINEPNAEKLSAFLLEAAQKSRQTDARNTLILELMSLKNAIELVNSTGTGEAKDMFIEGLARQSKKFWTDYLGLSEKEIPMIKHLLGKIDISVAVLKQLSKLEAQFADGQDVYEDLFGECDAALVYHGLSFITVNDITMDLALKNKLRPLSLDKIVDDLASGNTPAQIFTVKNEIKTALARALIVFENNPEETPSRLQALQDKWIKNLKSLIKCMDN